MRLCDGLTGQDIASIDLGANIEGSPAVFDDMFVIGTRGGDIVETPIEEATTIPAAFLASGIPLETTEWVAFTATTQEQLQDVLDACSASSRILIDPSGATGRLDVPAGRNVAMLMSPDGEVVPERVGFMLIVK